MGELKVSGNSLGATYCEDDGYSHFIRILNKEGDEVYLAFSDGILYSKWLQAMSLKERELRLLEPASATHNDASLKHVMDESFLSRPNTISSEAMIPEMSPSHLNQA